MGSYLDFGKQAGVGLMLGEEKGVAGVVVKQLVPRGSADRTGSVGVGDQLLIVGDEDVSQQTVGNMRHLIIGDMGSYCNVTFRSAASGQVYSVQLQRGTPEFLDSIISAPQHRGSHASLNPGEMRADAGGAGTAAAGDGRATLQEEADWLRSALRLAETHVRKDREELKSLHAIFERNEIDTGRRIQNLEERLEERDAERRGLEGRLWNAEEKVRALETKLSEAARREEFHNEEARKVYENEQQRLEFIQELKRHFEDEKRSLESELVRMHDGLRVERAARVEAEAVSEQLRQEVQRIQEQHMHAVRVNREGADRLKEQTEKIREISRANSALTIMLSEIQPRLTVLEQDAFSCRLPSEAEGRWNTAGNTLSAARAFAAAGQEAGQRHDAAQPQDLVAAAAYSSSRSSAKPSAPLSYAGDASQPQASAQPEIPQYGGGYGGSDGQYGGGYGGSQPISAPIAPTIYPTLASGASQTDRKGSPLQSPTAAGGYNSSPPRGTPGDETLEDDVIMA